MPFYALLSVLLLIVVTPHTRADTCGAGVSCEVGERSYEAVAPDTWNGTDPLPVLVHFHGWGRTGTNVVRNQKIAGAANENGYLLLAPNGLGRSWSFWSSGARDVPFVLNMLDDAAKRWPIAREQVVVSGFSYGGAMTWRLACERGADFAAFLPMAGTLWNFAELADCSAPVTLRQAHGLKDTVMDLPLGADGDPLFSVSPWRAKNECREEPDQTSKSGIMTRYQWSSCGSGKTVTLDLHDGGHIIPAGWLSQQLRDLSASGN